MLQPQDYLGAPVEDFIAAVASGEPTPGGGAVAAIGLAMAAGLTAMAASFSEAVLKDATAIRIESEAIRLRVAKLATDDAFAYEKVLAALRSARGEPERKLAVREALDEASEVPLRVVEDAKRVNELALVLFENGNRNLRGDALVAAHFSHAAAQSAAALVRFNLADGDDPRVRRAEELSSRSVAP